MRPQFHFTNNTDGNQHQCIYFHSCLYIPDISMCFIYIHGTLPCSPYFPSLCEQEFPKSIQCFCNALCYFGNTDRVQFATNRESMTCQCRCRCAHVSVKSKQMQLASIKCSRLVTAAFNAYCVISMDGDDDTYDGKTAGSHSCEVGATVNYLLGDTFSHDKNMHGNRFNVSFTTGIHNLLHEFWEP